MDDVMMPPATLALWDHAFRTARLMDDALGPVPGSHFPAHPQPEPCAGCGGLLCAECVRWNLTAVHFSTDGLCAFGHRLDKPPAKDTVPAAELAARLTEWIKDEGIEGNYPPDQIAARIVSQCHASNIERWLTTGHDYLRGMCRDIKDWDHMTLEERAAENYWHGHGTH